MGDADIALAHLGPSTVVGRGLGAYVALLIAGARPHLVQGAVLCDGPGLAGGGIGPISSAVLTIDDHAGEDGPPDPWALVELARDVRPADYADVLRPPGHPALRPQLAGGRVRPLATAVARSGGRRARRARRDGRGGPGLLLCLMARHGPSLRSAEPRSCALELALPSAPA